MATPYVYPNDVPAYWRAVSAYLATTRAAIGLPPLNGPDGPGSGNVAVGKEFVPYQLAPPYIVVVPNGFDYQAGRKVDNPPGVLDRYVAFLRWERFTAYLWGDPGSDYSAVSPYPSQTIGDSYNTTIELERELLIALVSQSTVPGVQPTGADWVQPDDVTRLGRLLELRFRIQTPVADIPWTALPFANSTTAGVVVQSSLVLYGPDGSGPNDPSIVVPSPSSSEP